MLKTIAGVLTPTMGTVKVNGTVAPMIELGAGFDPELTARENIFLNGAILGYPQEMLKERFDEIIDFAELKDFVDVPVKNFSSGMTTRLGFSIATIYTPDILIVDEIHRMNKDKQDLRTMNASSEQELLQTKNLINLADKNIEQLQKKAKNNKFWTKVLVGAGVVTGFLINNQL